MDHLLAQPTILQDRLPENPRLGHLPGTVPIEPGDWLRVDEVYAAQMAFRDHLLATRRDEVFRSQPSALTSCEEVLREVLARIADMPGFQVDAHTVRRPDGVAVDLRSDHPLLVAARLVQEDLCLLQPGAGGSHVLAATVLCFPASWRLDEKFGRNLIGLHRVVDEYDEGMERRVQRLFDGLQVGRPLCRGNLLSYATADLFAPLKEGTPRMRSDQDRYLRAERQCLVRLPESRDVLFSIHTYMVDKA